MHNISYGKLASTVYTDFKDWDTPSYVWLLFAMSSIGLLSAFQGSTLLGTSSAIFNILCVILVARGKISSYFWGLLGVLTYGYLAYSWQLYGDTFLNLIVYLPLQFIGLYMWLPNMMKETDNTEVVEFRNMNSKHIWYTVIGVVVFYVMALVALTLLSSRIPFIDAATTVLSITAMILMVYRFKAQWDFWIVVNILSIVMWSTVYFTESGGETLTTLAMWCIFLGNSVYGRYMWSTQQKAVDNDVGDAL